MEAVNRVNIAVLTDGKIWVGGGGRYTEEGDAEVTATEQKNTGERGVNEGSYMHKVAIVCN
jgi:hypothetical protein